MEKLRKSIFDNRDSIMLKNSKIDTYIKIEKENLYEQEALFINNIVKNVSFALPRDSFSCKYGILIYSFDHKDKDREVYISPDVYLIEGDCVVYEVLNHKEYFKLTTNQILISKEGKYFCEMPLKQFLNYVSAEDIVNYIEKYLNKDFEELQNIETRLRYLENFNIR